MHSCSDAQSHHRFVLFVIYNHDLSVHWILSTCFKPGVLFCLSGIHMHDWVSIQQRKPTCYVQIIIPKVSMYSVAKLLWLYPQGDSMLDLSGLIVIISKMNKWVSIGQVWTKPCIGCATVSSTIIHLFRRVSWSTGSEAALRSNKTETAVWIWSRITSFGVLFQRAGEVTTTFSIFCNKSSW